MGMDPIGQLEVHEVTIQVSGIDKVNVAAFNQFQDQLRAFITTASNIVANQPNTPPEKLQVRVVRQLVRPTAQ
jgi:hypothetical protein